MTLPRFARTATFRLTLLFAGLFGTSTLLLFGVLYWQILQYADTQVRNGLMGEQRGLSHLLDAENAPVLQRAVVGRAGSATSYATYYLLQSPTGEWIAGNVGPLPPREGFFETRITPAPNTIPRLSDVPSLFLGLRLEDGRYLFVGRRLDTLAALSKLLKTAFGGALALALVLATFGGVLLSLGFLRRIEAVNRTSRGIIAGNLSERIPVTGANDEFDQLAVNLNEMLARNEVLMEGLRQVSTDIAHDLRTPLARLRQRLEASRSRLADEDPTAGEFDGALEDIDDILATFAALLRIAQIEAGARRQGFRTVDLSAIFNVVADSYTPVAEDNGQTLVAEVEPGLQISGDRELLTQMLVNVVENAIRHAPEGARIALRLRRDKGRAIAEVSDNGPGIPEADRPKVFRRFYRLESNRSSAGHGLGLSLVAAIADLHRIGLSLEDNNPGLKVAMRF